MNKDRVTVRNSVEGTLQSTLIALCAPQDMKARLRSLSSEIDVSNAGWSNYFEVHLLILHELLGTFRPYLRWLTLELTDSVGWRLHIDLPFLTVSRPEMLSLLALARRVERLMHGCRARS